MVFLQFPLSIHLNTTLRGHRGRMAEYMEGNVTLKGICQTRESYNGGRTTCPVIWGVEEGMEGKKFKMKE